LGGGQVVVVAEGRPVEGAGPVDGRAAHRALGIAEPMPTPPTGPTAGMICVRIERSPPGGSRFRFPTSVEKRAVRKRRRHD